MTPEIAFAKRRPGAKVPNGNGNHSPLRVPEELYHISRRDMPRPCPKEPRKKGK